MDQPLSNCGNESGGDTLDTFPQVITNTYSRRRSSRQYDYRDVAEVCIHRIPHESSISTSAGRGITLDQRHAAADQINSIVSQELRKK
ncbi:hypothetical protein MTR_3g046927 [Medicago truncatula]|uniref:Uncharacterized protein n=1 Tax=Medicago truncatula TaxID=3880 RepID=A0A072UVB7_MEDTR|nr:hypothetical protein MTR_3g046927 [Medicago truncatula]